MDVVMGALQTEDTKLKADNLVLAEEAHKQIQLQQQHEKQKEEPEKDQYPDVNYSGKLEKRGGVSGTTWQSRFFKITSRSDATGTGTSAKNYFFAWYKKEGAAVSKSLNIREDVVGISVIWSSRTLSYDTVKRKVFIQQRGSIMPGSKFETAKAKSVPNHGKDEGGLHLNPLLALGLQHETIHRCYIFQIHVRGTEHRNVILKAEIVDEMMGWISNLVLAGDLQFSENLGAWVRPGMSESELEDYIKPVNKAGDGSEAGQTSVFSGILGSSRSPTRK